MQFSVERSLILSVLFVILLFDRICVGDTNRRVCKEGGCCCFNFNSTYIGDAISAFRKGRVRCLILRLNGSGSYFGGVIPCCFPLSRALSSAMLVVPEDVLDWREPALESCLG